MVPRIDEPYLGGLAHALISAASPRGLRVLIGETSGRVEQELEAGNGYPGIDGVIFSPFALDPEHLAARSHDVAMVLVGQLLPDSTADDVAVDNVGSTAAAVRR